MLGVLTVRMRRGEEERPQEGGVHHPEAVGRQETIGGVRPEGVHHALVTTSVSLLREEAKLEEAAHGVLRPEFPKLVLAHREEAFAILGGLRNEAKDGSHRVRVEQVGLAEDPVGQQEGAVGQTVTLATTTMMIKPQCGSCDGLIITLT